MPCHGCNTGSTAINAAQAVNYGNYGTQGTQGTNFVAAAAAVNGNGSVNTDSCTGAQSQALPYVTPNQLGASTQYLYDQNGNVVSMVRKRSAVTATQPCQRQRECPPSRQTVCHNFPQRRDNCYPTDPQPYEELYNDNFESMDIGSCQDNRWTFFQNGKDFIANDGRVRTGQDGLTISARPFTKKYPANDADVPSPNGWLDHFKTYLILNSTFCVPECGQVYAEATMSGKQYNTAIAPAVFGRNVINHNADLRLAHAALTVIDFETGLHAAIMHTNDSIYAHHEVLPLDRDGLEDERSPASHAGSTLISRRDYQDPLADIRKVGIAVDRQKGLTYYIANTPRYNVVNVGTEAAPQDGLYQFEGQAKGVTVNRFSVGLLLGTMMDAVQPNNGGRLDDAAEGLVQLTNFRYRRPWEPYASSDVSFAGSAQDRLFGQGASMKVQNVKVQLRC